MDSLLCFSESVLLLLLLLLFYITRYICMYMVGYCMVKGKGNGKRKVLVSLDISTDAKLRELISQKYKSYEKGLLSYEVEMALRHWLSLHTGAQNTIDPKPPNPTPKVQNAYSKIKGFLLTIHNSSGILVYDTLLPGQQIPMKLLEVAIQNVRGSDPRTVRGWKKTLEKNGLIKIVGTGTMVEVM